MLARGEDAAIVACHLVVRRNALKREFRIGLDPVVLALVEARNLMKYGDPIGPSATRLGSLYESWEAVIRAKPDRFRA